MIRSENWLKVNSSQQGLTAPKPKKILIIAPAWIGDMVMAQTLFKIIKHRQPDACLDVLAPKWTLNLVERMPEVHKGIPFPFGHGELNLLKRFAFAKALRQEGYDQAIILPGSFKSALTALWAKIPKRTGWLGEWRIGLLNDIRKIDKQKLPRMIQRFAVLGFEEEPLEPLELQAYYPSLTINYRKRQILVEKLQIKANQPLLALCPGAEYGEAKRWPPAYFSKLAEELLTWGWQVALFGSQKDQAIAREINDGVDQRCIDLTGKTTLLEAIDLLSLAKLVVANDSGLMHIAAAINRPLIVLYGSSSPGFTPPLTTQVEIMKVELPCSPCFKRKCPLGHFKCMKQLSPELVLNKISKMISYEKHFNR